ncbi:hypothetical protein HMPREF0454_02381, partial [Hafnia alvei ATCC 51873]
DSAFTVLSEHPESPMLNFVYALLIRDVYALTSAFFALNSAMRFAL